MMSARALFDAFTIQCDHKAFEVMNATDVFEVPESVGRIELSKSTPIVNLADLRAGRAFTWASWGYPIKNKNGRINRHRFLSRSQLEALKWISPCLVPAKAFQVMQQPDQWLGLRPADPRLLMAFFGYFGLYQGPLRRNGRLNRTKTYGLAAVAGSSGDAYPILLSNEQEVSEWCASYNFDFESAAKHFAATPERIESLSLEAVSPPSD